MSKAENKGVTTSIGSLLPVVIGERDKPETNRDKQTIQGKIEQKRVERRNKGFADYETKQDFYDKVIAPTYGESGHNAPDIEAVDFTEYKWYISELKREELKGESRQPRPESEQTTTDKSKQTGELKQSSKRESKDRLQKAAGILTDEEKSELDKLLESRDHELSNMWKLPICPYALEKLMPEPAGVMKVYLFICGRCDSKRGRSHKLSMADIMGQCQLTKNGCRNVLKRLNELELAIPNESYRFYTEKITYALPLVEKRYKDWLRYATLSGKKPNSWV